MAARWLLWFIAATVMRIFFLFGFRLRVTGMANVPARGGVVIASNHQSYFDPPLVGCPLSRMACYMARHTLFSNRLFGALIRGLNAFPVRRDALDRQALREAVQRLQAGECLVLFPEGTRTRDGSIGQLKTGVLMIADRAGVPVVPAVIEGAFLAWPRHGRMRRHPISIWYGRAISAAERKQMSRKEFAAALRAEMLKGQAILKEMQIRAR